MLITNEKSYLLFSLKKIPSTKEFTDYFGVKKETYMYQTFERIYNYIFNGAFDLFTEYTKYYSQEYLEFEFFLENYYNFNKEVIEEINNEKKLDKHIYYSNLSVKVDYGVDQLISTDYEDNKILSVLYKFFEEYKNED